MKFKIVTILIICCSLILSACQKDIDVFVPDPGQINGPDTAWYNFITPSMPVSDLRNSLLIPVHHDSIVINNSAFTLFTPIGLVCIFPPNSCVSNTGQTLSGTVTVEVQLLRKKGDMVRMNKPTTSNGRMLVSGGEVFISLKKEGQPVQLAPGKRIDIKVSDFPTNQNMEFFMGDESNPQSFNWLSNPDTAVNKVIAATQHYEILTNRMRWIQPAYLYDTTAIPRTALTAGLPTHYTNANTIVYAVFKDLRTVISVPGNVSTKQFTSIPLPNGKLVTLLAISKQGNDYFLGNALINTGAPAPYNQAVILNPVKTSLQEIKNFLNNL